MRMKNFGRIAAVCCLFSLSLFSAQAVVSSVGDGNDKYVTKEIKVDDFYRVKINTAFNVVYHHSKDSAGLIRIYGEENILDEVKPVSKDGTLEIKFWTFILPICRKCRAMQAEFSRLPVVCPVQNWIFY